MYNYVTEINIKRIKIDGFKNFKNIDLTLNNITSLLSINSYGKTNTLNALDLRVGDYLFDLMSGNSSALETLRKYIV